jgi:glycolate oxidase iron-sulfur subunit
VNEQSLKTRLSETADHCVKCGLCLPHCPTYRLREDEAESPRGRIALIQGLADGVLEPTPRLDAHLASCLECRACEAACPSLVAFGTLMDGARALRVRRLRAWSRRLRLARLDILSSKRGIGLAAGLAGLYRASGLAALAERAGIARASRLDARHRVAMQLRRPAGPSAPRGGARGNGDDVALFLGCVARASQPAALAAALRVLERLGLRVGVPGDQGCCGAMHRHAGFPERADRLLAANASGFADRRTVAVASACAAELRAHPELGKVREVTRFVADLDWPPGLGLRPLAARVAVHEPCSQRNILRDGDAAYDLLRRIPGLEPVALGENALCCGAAGTYLLDQPEMAQRLVQPKIRRLRALETEILVTTNTGCALHLAAGARAAGLDIEVLHPIELVERQLRIAASGPVPG